MIGLFNKCPRVDLCPARPGPTPPPRALRKRSSCTTRGRCGLRVPCDLFTVMANATFTGNCVRCHVKPSSLLSWTNTIRGSSTRRPMKRREPLAMRATRSLLLLVSRMAISRVPLQRPREGSRFRSSMIGQFGLSWRLCSGAPLGRCVCKNSTSTIGSPTSSDINTSWLLDASANTPCGLAGVACEVSLPLATPRGHALAADANASCGYYVLGQYCAVSPLMDFIVS
jgi:hypothetical protein